MTESAIKRNYEIVRQLRDFAKEQVLRVCYELKKSELIPSYSEQSNQEMPIPHLKKGRI